MLIKFKSFNLSVELFELTQSLKVPSYLRDQLNRASSSISLNLAEGYGKRTDKDRRKFYQIAYGSAKECEAILKLINCTDDSLIEVCGGIYKLLKYYQVKMGEG